MATKQPNIVTLEKLEKLNEKIKTMYEQKRKLTSKIVKKYGANEFLYELDEPNDDGQKFVRYKLVDNLEAFKTGEPMYKASAFERYGYECKYLKNRPKDKQ